MDILQNALYAKDIHRVANIIKNVEALRDVHILVTGATGLVCSSFIDLLLILNGKFDLNMKIIVTFRDETKAKNRFDFCNAALEFIHYDALEDGFSYNGQIDYIICGASNANPNLYVSNPVETIRTTVSGIMGLAECAVLHNTKRLLFISSSEVYGRQEKYGQICENDFGFIDILNSRSSYAEAKLLAENICASYAAEYGLDYVIVRPGHIYGPTASETDTRVASDFAYRAARGENLVLKSNGGQERSYCYCVDCAAALLMVLINGSVGEAYNIANDEPTTIRKIAQLLADAGKVKLEFTDANMAEKRTFNPMRSSVLDNSKLKGLGYVGMFSVEEGLEHTVRVLREMI